MVFMWKGHASLMIQKESIPWVNVFQKVIYFTWYDIPLCLFPIISRSVYPWPHLFSRYPASNKHETCPSLHRWVIGWGIPTTCFSLHWWRQHNKHVHACTNDCPKFTILPLLRLCVIAFTYLPWEVRKCAPPFLISLKHFYIPTIFFSLILDEIQAIRACIDDYDTLHNAELPSYRRKLLLSLYAWSDMPIKCNCFIWPQRNQTSIRLEPSFYPSSTDTCNLDDPSSKCHSLEYTVCTLDQTCSRVYRSNYYHRFDTGYFEDNGITTDSVWYHRFVVQYDTRQVDIGTIYIDGKYIKYVLFQLQLKPLPTGLL